MLRMMPIEQFDGLDPRSAEIYFGYLGVFGRAEDYGDDLANTLKVLTRGSMLKAQPAAERLRDERIDPHDDPHAEHQRPHDP